MEIDNKGEDYIFEDSVESHEMLLSEKVLKICSALRNNHGIFVVGDICELFKHKLLDKNRRMQHRPSNHPKLLRNKHKKMENTNKRSQRVQVHLDLLLRIQVMKSNQINLCWRDEFSRGKCFIMNAAAGEFFFSFFLCILLFRFVNASDMFSISFTIEAN